MGLHPGEIQEGVRKENHYHQRHRWSSVPEKHSSLERNCMRGEKSRKEFSIEGRNCRVVGAESYIYVMLLGRFRLPETSEKRGTAWFRRKKKRRKST